MAYEKFQVCKEIYIPIDIDTDSNISLDEYKAKYGIDLNDYLIVVGGTFAGNLKSINAKLFVCVLQSGVVGRVIPLDLFEVGGQNAIVIDKQTSYTADDGIVLDSFEGFGVDNGEIIMIEY